MDAPKAPDPKETAAAQGAMNKETAIATANLNNVNQITPYGNLTYSIIGTNDDGTPKYQAEQTFSPEMKALYDKYNTIASGLGDIGGNLVGNVADTYSKPFSLDNAEVEGRLAELGRARLDPLFAERQGQLETKLSNQGLQVGSPAWEAEMRKFSEGQNDAYNQLFLTGRAQASNEALTERNQGLNELTALLGGTQVQQPNFVNTPQTSVSGVDYAGLVNNAYNQNVSSYNAKLGGLGGIAGSLAGGWAMQGFPGVSDRRAKKDIRRVGKLDNGLSVYAFTYKGSAVPQIGLMADEVREVRPDAVVRIGGVDHVRYDLAVQ